MRTLAKRTLGLLGVGAMVLGLNALHPARSNPPPPQPPGPTNPSPPLAPPTDPHDRQPTEVPPLANSVFDNNEATTLSYQGLLVTVDGDHRQAADAAGPPPVITGQYRGKPIFNLRIDDGGQPTTVEVRRLDSTTTLPQIVIMSYTGGAHCCTITKLLTIDVSGTWHIVDGGMLDGDAPYRFIDLNGDGNSELVSVDNSFLYAFACYACSYAPTRISTLTGLDLRDTTRDPRYQDFLRAELRDMEKFARAQHDMPPNGYLAGWVAQKALVGELDAAWRTMLASYDRTSDDGLIQCRTAEPIEKCPESEQFRVSFPAALAQHLVRQGYLTADQGRRLDLGD
jgi:hypothetical protein